MNTIFNDVCVLVAAAFALTLVPGFRNLERSLLSRRDQGAVLLVFTILGLVEEATVSHAGLLNERIVAVCAAGLVAGPWVGLAVGLFVTWLAVAHHGLPLGAITTSMLCGGLAGEGTTVTMRIPLRKRFGVGLESPRAIPSELCELAPN